MNAHCMPIALTSLRPALNFANIRRGAASGTVVEVVAARHGPAQAPVERHGGVQITPPAYSYSAHRGMQRVLFDLKADAGREAFLRLAESADVVIESFRPGVVDRLGVGYEAGSGYESFIGTDVTSMRDAHPTVFIRARFHVADPAVFDSLTLRMRYDDGFVAYLNGVEIGRGHAPAELGFDAAATAWTRLFENMRPVRLSRTFL